MTTYIVRISATVTKDIEVDAESEEEADERAHALFTPAPEENDKEWYEQETESICRKRKRK